MKTAISIPDPLFQDAEQLAKRLRVSRSELYTRALAEFIEAHKDDEVMARLNALYATEDSSLDVTLTQLQLAALPKKAW
jgi:metal-responsive CopG/Arc/MetJ family transcriptional regulator